MLESKPNVKLYLRACESGPEACGLAYNIACGERISLNQLLVKIGEVLGHEVPADHVDPRPGDIRHSLAGIELAQARLDYRPRYDISEGLQRTAKAF